MDDGDVNILHGAKPSVSVYKGTVGQQIYEALIKYQDLPRAAICAETKDTISYKVILETTCQLAQALQIDGFSQNSVMAIYAENSLQYLYPIIASWYLGITVVPINHEYIKTELHRAVSQSKPDLMFCSLETLPKVRELQKVHRIRKILVMDLVGDIEGVQSLDSFIRCNSNRFLSAEQFKPTQFDTNEQLALVMSSSGTTGLPKGVMVTHKNLTYRFAVFREPEFMFIEKPASNVLVFAPRFHIVGLLTSMEALLMGHCTVLIKKFDPLLFLKCIEEYKFKRLILFPPVTVFLAKTPLFNQYDLSSVEDICTGGSSLSKETEQSIHHRFGKKTNAAQCYGLTETTVVVVCSPRFKHKIGACGKVVPHMAVKIVDIQTEKSLEANKSGEIWIKGPLITKGYIADRVATAGAFNTNGWFRTGDIGYYDEDGYLYIIDRQKDIIKHKGFQVAPAELEELLLKHPKVDDAAVVGVPHERDGELPAAFVCKKEGEQLSELDITTYISNQVSPQKQLRGGVYFVDELPRNRSGKVLRWELRKLVELKFSKL